MIDYIRKASWKKVKLTLEEAMKAQMGNRL